MYLHTAGGADDGRPEARPTWWDPVSRGARRRALIPQHVTSCQSGCDIQGIGGAVPRLAGAPADPAPLEREWSPILKVMEGQGRGGGRAAPSPGPERTARFRTCRLLRAVGALLVTLGSGVAQFGGFVLVLRLAGAAGFVQSRFAIPPTRIRRGPGPQVGTPRTAPAAAAAPAASA